MRLMHNNYYPLPDGTRIFTGGYHIQAERATANYAFTAISGYTYAGHKAAMLKREQEQFALKVDVLPEGFSAEKDNLSGIRKKVFGVWKKFIELLRRFFRK